MDAVLSPHSNAPQALLPEMAYLLQKVVKVAAEASRTHRMNGTFHRQDDSVANAMKMFRYVRSDELLENVVTALLSDSSSGDEYSGGVRVHPIGNCSGRRNSTRIVGIVDSYTACVDAQIPQRRVTRGSAK
jgi:hypothetical protein